MHGNGSGYDLIKRMQPGGDLQTTWIMFNHVRNVEGWMTFTFHVYDSFYCKVMMIAICDMQFQNTKAQCVMWQNLNKVMANNGVLGPNFKGFMADNVQANSNVVQIIYGSGDPSELMVDK
jgi:hypothetical protein